MTATDHFDVVIIGGGVAAGACASTLRDEGFSGSIAIACAEPHAPYTRPGLTKQVLRGEKPESAALWKPLEWYDEHDVTLLTGAAATDLDTRGKRVRVAGRSISYGSLVLATGAEPRALDLSGGDTFVAERTHVIRSFHDAHGIRPHLGAGARWLVIGGAFIGSEFAASARLTGSEVTQVMLEERILEGPFGDVAGAWFDARQRAHGVDVRPATSVEHVERDGDALRAQLSDGTQIVVDHICIGVGVAANVGLAQQARLELAEGGIAADASLRASAPDVYVAGDVCAYESELHGHRVRIEHWDVARGQGAHVARQIATGTHQPFTALPYFFGTMADWAFLEYVGIGSGRSIVRGSLDDDSLSIVQLDDDDVLVAIITVARKDDLDAARELIPARAKLDPARIADATTSLSDCIAGAHA